MPVPEFVMNFNFKLVYTNIVYNIQISSHATLQELFHKANLTFALHIDPLRFENYFIVCGQEENELAPAVSHHNLDHPLYYEFGEKWKQVSFYVRPCDISTHEFTHLSAYI
jgi:hypothetical protein